MQQNKEAEAIIHPLNPVLPSKGVGVWRNLYGCGDALALARAMEIEPRLYLVVTEDAQSALRLEHEIRFFLGKDSPVLHFPDWETLPYDIFSPLPEIVSERLHTLARLDSTSHGILLASVATLMQRLAPRIHILGNSLSLKPKDRLNIEETRLRLETVGYNCVSQVMQHGEFTVRGSILDLFPMGSHTPYRIELFDDDVESIRTFDVETQRSTEKVDTINLFPAREFPVDEEAIKRFRKAFRIQFQDISTNNPLYQDISKGVMPSGVEYYLPLFVDYTETLFDYLPAHTTLVVHGGSKTAAQSFYSETVLRYEQRKDYTDRPPLPPEILYLNPAQFLERLNAYPEVHIEPVNSDQTPADTANLPCRPLPALTLDSSQKQDTTPLDRFINDFQGRVLLVSETAGHREALLDSLKRYKISPRVVESWQDFIKGDASPCLVVAPLDHGLWINDPALAIITETQLSGEKVRQRRRRKTSAGHKLEQVFRNLEELEIDAPVVHQDHGVGRFKGLMKLNVGGMEAEFLALEYANGDKLYVPVSSLHLIGRYSGANPDTAPLHKLGSEQWQKARRKALERVRDIAAELLDIYAKRAVQKGRSFATDSDEYKAFTQGFPFEETPDQETAIKDVLKDMAQLQPMDRVICGDVGFGKTEVAMRAAFVAVQNGRQVAVLVPTTLLAQQHFQNFRDRFADWPIRIDTLSRFVGKKQQDEIHQNLKAGIVDIVIGTHKLLQKDMVFKDLGLCIVDEEHRFGVSQKEHFKKLRSELDFLSLTATPIPRTLNLAMSGLRDISIIATPPTNRHAIKTFVSEWDSGLIQEAVLREIKRGGQVYFLHNKIETMEKMVREIEALVPLARIRSAHGQMPERELESIMQDFYHQRFNVLLCTTIIESGIDVPTANTIIINRADLLGLAQLHQIRGRVGRSHHRAYAYLLTPSKGLLTPDAIKRLEAIESTGELGAGFMLSSHDLEIRGAGELLGDEQSGQIHEIGLTLYTELLERAVNALRAGRQPQLDLLPHEAGPEIDLQAPALIPDTYLGDVHTRLVLYKRIANAGNEDELRNLQIEMIDRFGLLPSQAKTLFAITGLKLRSARLGIRKIEAGTVNGRILFHPEPPIDPMKIITLIQTKPDIYKLDGQDKLRFTAKMEAVETRLEFIEALLDKLSG